MKTINHKLFFKNYPFRPLSESQVNNLNFLLDKLDGSETINRLSWYAYILATIEHETAGTFKPITEYGSQAYLRSKKYYPYIGRGYVQLTWNFHYLNFGKLLNIPLFDNPELANDPETAWKILEIGMVKGLYTGKKLGDYLNDAKLDFYSARKIINGLDRASQIAGRANNFFNALEWIDKAKAENGIDRYIGEAKP